MQLGGINMLIGICGKSGSGKSYISEIIKSYDKNTIYLDIDKIAHYILTLDEIKEKIKYFGDIFTNNEIDRKKLGKIVFKDKEKMDYLKELTYYYEQIIIDKVINDNQDKIIILDYLFLKDMKYFKMCDLTIIVDAPYNIRLNRVIKRDSITEEQFIRRDKSYDLNSEGFTYIIENIDKEKTKKKVSDIYEKSIIHR